MQILSFDAILVIIVLVFILISLYDEIVGPAFTFVVGVVVLTLFGVITPKEMLAGFANEQILVIIILLLVGDVIRRTGVIDGMFDRIFRGTKSKKGFLIKMMLPVAGISAFLNNTPLVAIMMPYVMSWSKRHNIAPSKFLIPLSYAAILGGCATLIGTSTNLIVNGLVSDQNIFPDLEPMGMFEWVWVGVPMIVIGLIYLYIFSDKLLPCRRDLIENLNANEREYMVEAIVKKKSPLIGKTIPESGLLDLPDLSVAEINRHATKKVESEIIGWGTRIASTNLDYRLEQGDVVVFTGNTSAVSELVDVHEGLTLAEVGFFLHNEQTNVVEVVVSHNSSLVRHTVKESMFRRRFDSVVLGIHRNGEKLKDKTGDIKMESGDVILLLAGPGFATRAEYTKDFYPLQTIREINKPGLLKGIVLLGGLALVIIMSVMGMISLFMGLVVYLMVLMLTKIADPKKVARSIDYDLGLIIVMALALGTAMVNTGLADIIAWGVINAMRPLGLIGYMTGLYIVTALLAAYITNKAAVALIIPIALTIASNLGVNPVPFVLITAFASAANFITPHGYQTNLMVYGPGGYKFKDFMKIGWPLTLIYMVVAITILYFVYL